jgi:hypothetical protein
MRTKILAVALSLATLIAVPVTAFAAPRDAGTAAKVHQRADKGDHDKQFPMAGAEFKAKVDGRLAKSRERMEKRVAKLDAQKANEVRAKFNAGAAKVNAEVAKAVADGTVTKEEAKDVHKAMREMHPGKGKHGGEGKQAHQKRGEKRGAQK